RSELDAAAYGTLKTPIAVTSTSSTGKDRPPVVWRTGTDASKGARAASPTMSARLEPRAATTDPPGIPSANAGSVWQARTRPIFAVDPVVARTNQGSATTVMFVPVSEMNRERRTARTAGI